MEDTRPFRLLALVRRLPRRPDLAEALQEVAVELADVLELGAVAVHVTEPDGALRALAVHGPQEALSVRGRLTERVVFEQLFSQSEEWGSLCFFDHHLYEKRYDPATSSRPGGRRGGGEDGWEPGDVLLTPVRSSSGELLAVVSLDRPRDGRRPGAERRLLLELVAAEAADALEERSRRQATSELVATYKAGFDLSATGLAVLDDSLTLLAANSALAELAGVPASALPGRAYEELIDAAGRAQAVAACLATLDGSREAAAVDHRYRPVGGRLDTPRVRSTFRVAGDGAAGRRVVVRSERLEVAASAEVAPREPPGTDPLTGLPDRAAALEQVERVLERRHPGQVAGLLVLDLDGLVQARERHGRDAADAMVTRAATLLQGTLRGDETLYRMGGNDFALVCEDVKSRAGAGALAERLIASVEHERAVVPGVPGAPGGRPALLPLSVGIGIALADDHTPRATVGELVAAAGNALREAKRSGPGRWHCAPGRAGVRRANGAPV